jgi:hypothetical protein
VGRPWLNQVWEPEGQVPQCDDAVRSDDFAGRFFQNGKHQLQLLLAKLRAATNKQF